MFPADFAYARARSLDEALDLLDEAAAAGQEAKLIAGGQSLLPMMKLRLAAPQVLIDIAGLPELTREEWAGPSGHIGALTTYRQLAGRRVVPRAGTPAGTPSGTGRLVDEVPALADALAVLADPQVRARGTVGGAVAHGDPAADLPAVLLALDAEVVIASRQGRHEERFPARRLPGRWDRGNPAVGKRGMLLEDFLQGIYTTDLAEDEIITHIYLNGDDARASAYAKFPHPASHLPLAGVCAVVHLREGVISHAKVAVTGISPRPYRARETEALLKDTSPAPEAIATAAAQVTRLSAAEEVTLLGDQHASAPYRAHLAEVLTRRALARALARAGEAAEREEQ
jgi:aerobic carbon-monoxide dehydrogenase medium subunit